jgi:hypothetical protein
MKFCLFQISYPKSEHNDQESIKNYSFDTNSLS